MEKLDCDFNFLAILPIDDREIKEYTKMLHTQKNSKNLQKKPLSKVNLVSKKNKLQRKRKTKKSGRWTKGILLSRERNPKIIIGTRGENNFDSLSKHNQNTYKRVNTKKKRVNTKKKRVKEAVVVTAEAKYFCSLCPNKCCKMIFTTYQIPNIVWPKRETYRRAGVFVVDPDKKYVLLVQSCGFLWGPPKGAMKRNETTEEAAIRELKEETGISIHRKQLGAPINTNGGTYFLYTHPRTVLKIPESKEYNDVTGISWLSLKCLKDHSEYFGKFLNQPAKVLISKFMYSYGYVKLSIIVFPRNRNKKIKPLVF